MNIEQAARNWLASRGHDAYVDVPNPRPGSFVTVERTGGGKTDLVVDEPTLAVQSWGPSLWEASQLALAVDADMADMVRLRGVDSVERVSLYRFPDPDSGQPRYEAVYQLQICD